MAEATAKTVLGKISQGHLECPICFCRFKDPKILDCLHSFCLNCLEEMLSKQQLRTDTVTCPVCRRETQVPGDGLQGLANCFFLSSLVDEVDQQEQVLGEALSPTPTCEQCDEGLEAASRCLDCKENICHECQKAHERLKYTKDHRIVPKGEVHPSRSTDLGKTVTPNCRKHDDQKVHFYCDTCEALICGICAATDHRSVEHKFSGIEDSTESFCKDVDGILKKFEKYREQVATTERSIEHARNRLKTRTAKACSDISTKADEEMDKIRNKARLLTEKLTQISWERDEAYEKILNSNRDKTDRADQIIAAVSGLMEQADSFELLDLKPKVMHNLKFQEELTVERANHGLSFVGVELCQDVVTDSDLGEISNNEKWQLKEEFGEEGMDEGEFTFGSSVACFSNGDIVVTDTTLHRLSMFTSLLGYHIAATTQDDDKHEFQAPWGLSVTSDDLLVVTDKKKVRMFDKKLQLVREFTPSPENTQSNLTSIAVNTTDKWLAVADKSRKVVSLHDLEGSLIKTIPNKMIDVGLAIDSKERLFIPDYVAKRLLCVDLAGNEVFNVKTFVNGKPAGPTGVLCDDFGDIYVAVHSGKLGSAEVQHFDMNGVFIETVAEQLYNPLEMAFTPEGDVVVADKHSFKIFQRV